MDDGALTNAQTYYGKVLGSSDDLRTAENKFLFQPPIRFPFLNDAALKRDGLVVIKKRQPRLEGFFADSWVRRHVLSPGRESQVEATPCHHDAKQEAHSAAHRPAGCKSLMKKSKHGRKLSRRKFESKQESDFSFPVPVYRRTNHAD